MLCINGDRLLYLVYDEAVGNEKKTKRFVEKEKRAVSSKASQVWRMKE